MNKEWMKKQYLNEIENGIENLLESVFEKMDN